MASVQVCRNLRSKLNKKFFIDFKNEFLLKLFWNESTYKTGNNNINNMQKIVNSCKFWFNSLTEVNDTNVLLITLYSEGLVQRIEEHGLLLALKNTLGLNDLAGFHVTRFNSVIALNFSSKSFRDKVANEFLFYEEFIVINADWIQNDLYFKFRIIWLPSYLNSDSIVDKMKGKCNILSIKKEVLIIDEEDTTISGNVIGVATCIGGTLQDIPHILDIDGYQGLILISKRQPMCLTCYDIGHVAAECARSFCKRCRKITFKLHEFEIKKNNVSITNTLLVRDIVHNEHDDPSVRDLQTSVVKEKMPLHKKNLENVLKNKTSLKVSSAEKHMHLCQDKRENIDLTKSIVTDNDTGAALKKLLRKSKAKSDVVTSLNFKPQVSNFVKGRGVVDNKVDMRSLLEKEIEATLAEIENIEIQQDHFNKTIDLNEKEILKSTGTKPKVKIKKSKASSKHRY